MNHPPVALSIAGSDCSGGAGIQADGKVFQHFGLHGLSAVTCVVSETALTVRRVHPVPPDLVADQIALLMASFPVAAAKTGMLFSLDHIRVVSRLLARNPPPFLVVDPVMVASTGDPLIESEAIQAYQSNLLPLATLITPNLPEAETLIGGPIRSEGDAEAVARELASRYQTAILLKGGHRSDDSCDDLLFHHGKIRWFRATRIHSPASHGTGCTLSAAITARLALGDDLPTAVDHAKSFVRSAILLAYSFPGTPPIPALNQGTTGGEGFS